MEWDVSFNGNMHILHYDLRYFINGSATSISKRVDTTSYNVESLKPNEEYMFEVTATNDIGTSDVKRVSVTTREASKSFFLYIHNKLFH